MTRTYITHYDHGLPYSENLYERVIKPCNDDLQRNPKILVIDGAPGTGKTTLAVHIMDSINGFPVDLENNIQIAMGGKDLQGKAEKCKENNLRVIAFDEVDFEKAGALTRFNRELFGFFKEYRTLGIFIILITQNISWIDNRLWQLGVVQGLIHLSNAEKEYTDYEVYHMDELSFLLKRMDKLGKFQSVKAYSMCKGSWRGHFLDLPKDRSRLLGKLSDKQKSESRKRRIKKL